MINKLMLQFISKQMTREEFIKYFIRQSLITKDMYFNEGFNKMPIYRPCEIVFFENRDCFHYCKHCKNCWNDVIYNELKFKGDK